jgi:hypothetical protein
LRFEGELAICDKRLLVIPLVDTRTPFWGRVRTATLPHRQGPGKLE